MSDHGPDDVERPDPEDRRGLSVLWGLVALVAVAVVVGGVLALGAAFATRATGLSGGGGGATAAATGSETLVLPEPSDTASDPTPYITLRDVSEPPLPSSSFSDTPSAPSTQIQLFAAEDRVSPMQPITLSGSYVGGSGAVLQVQQLQSGQWNDFPVTVPVNGDEFSTFIKASAIGENHFRVVDTSTGKASNEVLVTIS